MLKFYMYSKGKVSAFICLIALAFCFKAQGQQFTAGRLVVERVGVGTPQSSSGTAIFLDEYTTAGVPGISIALPTVTSGSVNRAVESGVATSDGMLSRSVDGNYLVVPGYDAGVGDPAIVTSSVNKVITRVDANGGVASTVVTNATAFSANNFRSVVTTDGSEYWLSGAGNGAVHVLHQGSTTAVGGTQISSAITDNRALQIYNSQLIQSTAVGPNTGIYNVGVGLPTTVGNPMTIDANTGGTGDPYGFVIVKNAALPVMYVVDFNNKLVRKYFQVGANWFGAGSVSVLVGGSATGFYNITGNVSGGVVHLYATTGNAIGTNSRVVSFSDATSGSTVITGTTVGTTIVGPTSNTSIRGITFVPFTVNGIATASPSVCHGTGTTITISGNPNTVVTYAIGGVPQLPVTISGTGTYSFNTGPLTSNTTYTVLSATDGNITQNYAYNVTVSVLALPTITTGPGSVTCAGGSATLTAGGGVSYTWAPAAPLTSTTGASVMANPTVSTTFTVTGTDVNGCMNTARVAVTVNALPIVSTSTPVAICTGSSTGLAASGALTYTWSPVVGLSATTGTHVTASPTSTTSYTITGTNFTGCSNTIVNTVSVNSLPIVTNSGDVAICNGSSTGLTAGGAATYGWAPAGGLSALIGNSVTASPSSTTTYTITGTDTNGCRSSSSLTVMVNPLPVVSAGGGASICNGASTLLTATGAVTYVWTPAGTLTSTAGDTTTAHPATTTTYTITGTDGNGCVNWNQVTVSVYSAPFVSAIATVPAYCIGGSSALNAVGAASYSWAPSTGLSATSGSSVTANPTATTTYTVVGTSVHGCVSSATVTVTVYPIPVISAGPGVTICNGALTTLTATGGVTYTWSPGYGLSTITGPTVVAHPAVTTTYTVTAINVCVGTTTVTVTVDTLPIVLGAGVTICSGSSGSISATGAATYTWSPATNLSATVGSSVTANPTSNTIYNITGTDANGCVGHATATVLVNLLPTISAGSGVTICNGASTTLTATGAATYNWTPATGLSATTGSSVLANPTSTSSYTVTGTSVYGCVNTASVHVTVNPLPSVYAVTGGGSFCAGGIGVPVGLAGSQGGINYDLYNGTLFTGINRTGTGSALDFGHPGAGGFYRIVATDLSTACHDTMSGGAGITITPGPAVVSVTGGGEYCVGGTGVHVGLAGSVIGVEYQMYFGGSPLGSPIAGAGGAIDFGLQTGIGTYTAVATSTGPLACSSNMLGSATISTLPLPAVFSITGGGVYCEGGDGVHIGLNGSQIGIRYNVDLAGTPYGGTLIGMATPLDFGLFTTPGTYTVTGVSSTTGCRDTMSGVVTVTITPTPVISGSNYFSKSQTTTLTASIAGGKWRSQHPAILSVDSLTGVVTGVSLGAGLITYTLPTGCYDTHYMTVAFNVGTPVVNTFDNFTLSPNPNNGAFSLQGSFGDGQNHDVTIEVTNLLGQAVYTGKATALNGDLNEHIELNGATPGLYVLSVRTENGSKQFRFVKE